MPDYVVGNPPLTDEGRVFGIKSPRSRWIIQRSNRVRPGWPNVLISWQRRKDVVPHFASGSYVWGWWTWFMCLTLPRTVISIWRWHEEWAR